MKVEIEMIWNEKWANNTAFPSELNTRHARYSDPAGVYKLSNLEKRLGVSNLGIHETQVLHAALAYMLMD